MANRANRSGTNITGVSGAQHGAQRNAQSMQRAAQQAGQAGFEIGTLGGATGAGAGGVQLQGNNITGVSGAQHGRQKNAQAVQRAGRQTGR